MKRLRLSFLVVVIGIVISSFIGCNNVQDIENSPSTSDTVKTKQTDAANQVTNVPSKNDSPLADTKTNINDSSYVPPLTNKDFIINDKNNYIELGGTYGDLKTNDKIIETVLGNEMLIYDIYVYENFQILTQLGGGSSSIIGSIDLTTPVIQTSRGICVGDTISEVVEKFGNPDESSIADSIAPGQYIYQYNGQFITFFFDKAEKVVCIRFEIV